MSTPHTSSLLTGYIGRPNKTPIGLVNNGVKMNANGANQFAPTIFSSETAQVLQLPSRGGPGGSMSNTSLPTKHASASELLFGSRPGEMQLASDTSSFELSRLQIVTMRQLQRALQNKISQSTRNPMDVWTAFSKLDRRKKNHLNLADLVAAVRG